MSASQSEEQTVDGNCTVFVNYKREVNWKGFARFVWLLWESKGLRLADHVPKDVEFPTKELWLITRPDVSLLKRNIVDVTSLLFTLSDRLADFHAKAPAKHHHFRVPATMDRYLLQHETGKSIPTKSVYLIRHGESTHNAHVLHSQGADLNDAGYIDAPLTTLGVTQAKGLQSVVPGLRPEVIVTSPMTRATQTCLHATELTNAPIVVNPLCRERLAYACDIGNTVTTLRRRFPMLDYGGLSDVWWWAPDEDVVGPEESLAKLRERPPGDFKKAYHRAVEPGKEVQKRVDEFRLWLLKRPESRIVVFAHGVFNTRLLGDGSRMSNCEVRKLVL